MLVLSRRAGEAILIGGNVEVVILGTDGGQVRVGIRAPRDITVLRKELLQAVEAENRLAAAGSVPDSLGALVKQADLLPKSVVK
ncbi:MAG: carbon storage regulator CsrA [Chloroflexota bacterium]